MTVQCVVPNSTMLLTETEITTDHDIFTQEKRVLLLSDFRTIYPRTMNVYRYLMHYLYNAIIS